MGVNKNEILKAVFKSKDGVSWNELSEYLNEYTKDLLMELYENDMIEPHKNFMIGEDINTVEDGIVKLINWYESDGSKFEQRKAALPIFDVSQQRELLKAFYAYIDDKWALGMLTDKVDEVIEGFEKSL